jgi:hypothetical protein
MYGEAVKARLRDQPVALRQARATCQSCLWDITIGCKRPVWVAREEHEVHRRRIRSAHAWSASFSRRSQWENSVKFCLTDHQVFGLLCVLGQRRLCTVRSTQSTENAHDKPNPAHRTICASASCCRRYGRFGDCFPVCDGDGVVRHAGALTISSAALVMGSRTIPFSENGQCPIASLKRGDLFELFEFAHLCGDGSLAGIELLPL